VVSITEQFNPLIKFDLGFLNSLLASAEMRRARNLSLSFVNNQLTEITSNEFIVGMGYRIKGIRFNISGVLGGGKKTRTNSDLNLKLDFSIRRNKTVLRRVDQDINQISTGQQVMTLNFSADYNLSTRFNVRFYFDKVINTPTCRTNTAPPTPRAALPCGSPWGSNLFHADFSLLLNQQG
jgi:cell surface protein SprA